MYRTSTNREFRKTTNLTSQCGMMHEPRRLLHIKILRTKRTLRRLHHGRRPSTPKRETLRDNKRSSSISASTKSIVFKHSTICGLWAFRGALESMRRMHWSMRGGATSWSAACGAETRGSLRDFGITRSENVNRWFGLPVYAVCSGGNVLF